MTMRWIGCAVWLTVLNACSSSGSDGAQASGSGGSRADAASPAAGDTPGSSGSSGSNGSSGGAGGSASASADTPEGFCSALVDATVRLGASCSGADVALWRALFDSGPECRHVATAVAKGRLAFSVRDAAACAGLFDGLDCETAATSTVSSLATSCANALVGKVPLGGTCRPFEMFQSMVECADGARCVRAAPADCTGICRKRIAAGGSCVADKDCEDGASCVNVVCVANAKPGAACGGYLPGPLCGKGFFCEGGDPANAGRCAPRRTSGPCTASADCAQYYRCGASGQCEKQKPTGAACTSSDDDCATPGYCSEGKCAATLASLGEPCGIIGDEKSPCGEGFCKLAAGATGGTCRAKTAAGEACTETYLECAGDNARCDSTTGKCVACDGI